MGIKCLYIPEKSLLSDRMIQDMFIYPKTGVVQAFLLAQIARSESSHHGFGIEFINLAMDVFEKAKSLVGCRLVRIDCEDELIPYYKSNGFTMVCTNEDGTLNQMLTFVSPLDAEC